MSAESPDIAASISHGLPADVVADFLRESEIAGFATDLEEREPEVFAAFEWAMTTAVVLFLARKFIDTFAEQAAKDAYPAVKAALLRVIRRTTGPGRTVNPQYVSSTPHKTPTSPPSALSVLVLAVGGISVTFRFPADVPEHLHQIALERLLSTARTLQNHVEPISVLGIPPKAIVYTFDSAEAAWREIDMLAEARAARERSRRQE